VLEGGWRKRSSDGAPVAEAVGDNGEVVGITSPRPMLRRTRADLRSGYANITLCSRTRRVTPSSPKPLRPDRVAAWSDVLCRYDSRFRQPARRDAARGAVLCVAGQRLRKNRTGYPLPRSSCGMLGQRSRSIPTGCAGPMAFAGAGIRAIGHEQEGYGRSDSRRERRIIGEPREAASNALIMGPSARLIDERSRRKAS